MRSSLSNEAKFLNHCRADARLAQLAEALIDAGLCLHRVLCESGAAGLSSTGVLPEHLRAVREAERNFAEARRNFAEKSVELGLSPIEVSLEAVQILMVTY